jgi:regulatory protein
MVRFEKNNFKSYFGLKLHKMSYPRKEYNPDRPRKYWSLQEAKVKIAAYCAYQERCQEEVRTKLAEKGLFGDQAEELISHLIEEGFLNEERFAQAFVRGKFNLKKWGKIKITQELKLRNVSPNCIKSGMKEIDPEEYWQKLLELVEKKSGFIKEPDLFRKKYKIQQYLMGRGFESDLVQSAVETVFSGQNL